MDLTRLRIFVAVAEHGSFAGAAGALRYTPSAVSQQMARLETEAGAALFRRSRRGVELTHAGARLETRAREILGLVADTRAELSDLREAQQRLRVGTFATATRSYVLDALVDVRVGLAGAEPVLF